MPKLRFGLERMENIVEKRENADFWDEYHQMTEVVSLHR